MVSEVLPEKPSCRPTTTDASVVAASIIGRGGNTSSPLAKSSLTAGRTSGIRVNLAGGMGAKQDVADLLNKKFRVVYGGGWVVDFPSVNS